MKVSDCILNVFRLSPIVINYITNFTFSIRYFNQIYLKNERFKLIYFAEAFSFKVCVDFLRYKFNVNLHIILICLHLSMTFVLRGSEEGGENVSTIIVHASIKFL